MNTDSGLLFQGWIATPALRRPAWGQPVLIPFISGLNVTVIAALNADTTGVLIPFISGLDCYKIIGHFSPARSLNPFYFRAGLLQTTNRKREEKLKS